MPEIPDQRYRVGRHVGRTIYRQVGSYPSDADELVGLMDTQELAEQVVAGLNRTSEGYRAGYAEAVARLRDDARYRNWWSAHPDRQFGTAYWAPDGRHHLADYLETVGADHPRKLQQDVTDDDQDRPQCPKRFDCEFCRCILPAGHDGDHDQHCQGRPTP